MKCEDGDNKKKVEVSPAQNQSNSISIQQFLPRVPLSAGRSEAIIANNQVPQTPSYAQALIGENTTAGASAKTPLKLSGSKVPVPFQTVTRRRSQPITASGGVKSKTLPQRVIKPHVELKKSNPRREKTAEPKSKKNAVPKTFIRKSGKVLQDPEKSPEKKKMFPSPTDETDKSSTPQKQDPDKVELPDDSSNNNPTYKSTDKDGDDKTPPVSLNSPIAPTQDSKVTIRSDETVNIDPSLLEILKSKQYNDRTASAAVVGEGSAEDVKKLMQLLGNEYMQTHSAASDRFHREQKLKQIREINALNAQINKPKLESLLQSIDDERVRNTVLNQTSLLKPRHHEETSTPETQAPSLIGKSTKKPPQETFTGPKDDRRNNSITNPQISGLSAGSLLTLNDSNVQMQSAPNQEKILQTFLDDILTSKNQLSLSSSQQTLPPHVPQYQASHYSSTATQLDTSSRNGDEVPGLRREQMYREESQSQGQKGAYTSKRTIARLKKAENTNRKMQKQYNEMQQTLRSCLSMMPPTPPASPALTVPSVQSQPSSFYPPYQIPPILPRQPMSNYWQPGQFQYQQAQMPWQQDQAWSPQYPGQNQQLIPFQFAPSAPQQPYHQSYGQGFQPFYPYVQPSQGQYQAQSIPNQVNRSDMLLNDIYTQLSKRFGNQP